MEDFHGDEFIDCTLTKPGVAAPAGQTCAAVQAASACGRSAPTWHIFASFWRLSTRNNIIADQQHLLPF